MILLMIESPLSFAIINTNLEENESFSFTTDNIAMNRTLATSIFLFLSCFLLVQSQNRGPQAEVLHTSFEEGPLFQITHKDSLAVWRERVMLHVDAESYKPKETLFFKAYVLTGPKQLRVSASDVLRVELLDAEGNLVTDQYHKIENGTVNGIVALPKKIETGKYYLRAYTRWMLNYGGDNLPLKEVWISKSKSREDGKSGTTTVFPESGSFVAGLENKGVVSDGNGNTINGIIIDEKGIKVANVMDYGSGLATFTFVPDIGKNYYFEKSNGEKIKLIQPLKEGAVLLANTIEDQKIQIRIGVTAQLQEDTYYLKGSRKGKQFLKSEIIFDNGKSFVEIDINKEGLPRGLLNLTLEDANGQIWAERPLYIEVNDLQLGLNEGFELLKDGTRKMRYTVKLSDLEGNPIASELMIRLKAVDNTSDTGALASDGRGMGYLKDLQVLAQRVPEGSSITSENELPDQIKYAFQSGLEFYGQAYDFNNAILIDNKIKIYINNKKDVEVREVATNSEGLFTLTGLQFEGEVTMTFRRDGKNVREQLVKVIPYQYELPELKLGQGTVNAMPNPVRKSGQMIPQKRLSDFDFEDEPSDLIPLEEVTLVGPRGLRKLSASVYGIEPDRVVYQDLEKPKTLPQLFLGIPGVYVAGIGDLNPSLKIPKLLSGGPILWVVDGVPLPQNSYIAKESDSRGSSGASSALTTPALAAIANTGGDPSSGPEPSPLREVMDMVPFVDVERIEFLFGPNAAVYGTRGAGGVILIYTKNGAYSDFLDKEAAQLAFKGFQPPIDVEDYFTSRNKKLVKSRSASTLYWNPLLTTDENGEASFELVVPENLEQVLFDAKVITKEGKRGSFRTLAELQSNN
ncbi:hypothetical protein FGF1_32930 [Flavobacteriaceae bacterium GF1]